MLVPESFAEQVEALSSSTPREAIANLLSALMPRVQASTRPPAHPINRLPEFVREYPMEPYLSGPDPMSKLTRTKSPRTRMPRSKPYRVLNERAASNHRPSWRRAMVAAIVRSTSEASALEYMRDHYPNYYAKGVDIAWCVEQRYITFEPEGE